MPPRFAFFDVDETLISIKSMFDFLAFWHYERDTLGQLAVLESLFAQARVAGASREHLNRMYYRALRGAELAALRAAGQRWFRLRFRNGNAPYHAAAVAELRRHQASGVNAVFVSGSMAPILAPIAADLEVRYILCAQLVLDEDARLTGEIGAPQTIGAGKAAAVTAFLHHHGALARDCFAYGDDISDVAMLELVGTPVAVGHSAELAAVASQRGWSSLPV
jgi:HAD superfamily hydrolase (TIGR01490 family)